MSKNFRKNGEKVHLVRIEHFKCNDWAGTSYVWVDDNMGIDRLEELCDQAQARYLTNEHACDSRPATPRNPGYMPEYGKYPDMKVSEVTALWKVEKDAYDQWMQKRKETRKPFAEVLEQIGEGSIRRFHDPFEEIPKVDVDWGHRHGTYVEFGETELKPDFPLAEEDNNSI
jgi:hypothetical protein